MKNNYGSAQKEKLHENIGSWVAVIFVILPALIVSGFMPDWNIFTFPVYLTIATLGAGTGGVIYTKRVFLGLITGCITGAGALIGIKYYVYIRDLLIESHTYSNLEILIGAALGAIPGIAIYFIITKNKSSNNTLK